MSKNFWVILLKFFFVLVLMEDVIDVVFCYVVKEVGVLDVFFIEFINLDSYCYFEGKDSVCGCFVFIEDE